MARRFSFMLPLTTEIFALSLHDALPILGGLAIASRPAAGDAPNAKDWPQYNGDNRGWRFNSGETALSPATAGGLDRKSTRLNSSHVEISYAVFCLKKKNNTKRRN